MGIDLPDQRLHDYSPLFLPMASYGTITEFGVVATVQKIASYPMGRYIGDNHHRSEFIRRGQ